MQRNSEKDLADIFDLLRKHTSDVFDLETIETILPTSIPTELKHYIESAFTKSNKSILTYLELQQAIINEGKNSNSLLRQDSFDFKISFGNLKNSKTKLLLGVQFGNYCEDDFQKLLGPLSISLKACITLKFVSETPEATQKFWIMIFEEIRDYISSTYHDLMSTEQFKFSSNIIKSTTIIVVEFFEPTLINLVESLFKAFQEIVPINFKGEINFEFQSSKNISDVYSEELQTSTFEGKNILLHLFEGSIFKMQGRIENNSFKNLRTHYLKNLATKKHSDSSKIDFAILLLLNQAYGHIRFDSEDNYVLNKYFNDASNSLKALILILKQKIQQKDPFVRLLLEQILEKENEFLKQGFMGIIKIPFTTFNFHIQSEGLSKLLNFILN